MIFADVLDRLAYIAALWFNFVGGIIPPPPVTHTTILCFYLSVLNSNRINKYFIFSHQTIPPARSLCRTFDQTAKTVAKQDPE